MCLLWQPHTLNSKKQKKKTKKGRNSKKQNRLCEKYSRNAVENCNTEYFSKPKTFHVNWKMLQKNILATAVHMLSQWSNLPSSGAYGFVIGNNTEIHTQLHVICTLV